MLGFAISVMSTGKRILTLATFMMLAWLLAGCFAQNSAETPPLVNKDDNTSAADEATAELLHPLSIGALRARTYTGSDFVIEEVLDPGDNYQRYIASYLSDGFKIYALMTVPDGEKPAAGFPVIIFNHGYIPPSDYRTTERYVAYVDAFARHGYIVIKSDYRGHGNSEGPPAAAYGEASYVIDVLNAVASARRYPDANPNQIGMWGHSMGGYITLRAMVVDPGIKAGVIWSGVVASYDELFVSWFRPDSINDSSNWLGAMVETHGTPEDNPAFWDSLSANSYLADLSGPIQLQHGTGDTGVPYKYSVQLDERIRDAGKTVELFLHEGDDHNISTNRDVGLTLSVVFFDQHVAGLFD
jgi:uncharacterized protein